MSCSRGRRRSAFGRLPGEAAGEGAATEAERVAARVTGATTDSNAKTRVQAGLVDPSYTAMGRAMLEAWDPNRALPETTLEIVREAANGAVLKDGQTAVLCQWVGRSENGNSAPVENPACLVVLVTPTLIDPAGNPIHPAEEIAAKDITTGTTQPLGAEPNSPVETIPVP